MARSTKGLYKRGNIWWMTYFDASASSGLSPVRLPTKKTRKGDWLIDARKRSKGCFQPHRLSRSPLEDLQERYLSFVGHQRGVATKHYHFAHFTRVWGNPPIHPSRWKCWTSTGGLRLGEGWARHDQPGDGHLEACA